MEVCENKIYNGDSFFKMFLLLNFEKIVKHFERRYPWQYSKLFYCKICLLKKKYRNSSVTDVKRGIQRETAHHSCYPQLSCKSKKPLTKAQSFPGITSCLAFDHWGIRLVLPNSVQKHSKLFTGVLRLDKVRPQLFQQEHSKGTGQERSTPWTQSLPKLDQIDYVYDTTHGSLFSLVVPSICIVITFQILQDLAELGIYKRQPLDSAFL